MIFTVYKNDSLHLMVASHFPTPYKRVILREKLRVFKYPTWHLARLHC